MKTTINIQSAPAAIGPYSQGIKVSDFIFFSGQIPVDPKTNEMVEANIETQTTQVLENIKALLTSQGLDFSNVVKTTVFLKDMNDFAVMNRIYGEYFTEPYPARSAVQVGALPKGALVEIETIVHVG